MSRRLRATRNPPTGIWNASIGYPGDPAYREFHRDIGFDRPIDELTPVITAEHLRRPTGFRYWRVTDRTGDHREPYDPVVARRPRSRNTRSNSSPAVGARWIGWPTASQIAPPVLVAPFDAELFGHWWWEGPEFLDAMLRALPAAGLEAITPIDYLQRHPTNPVATPGASSWGAGGHAQVWLNDQTDWIHQGTRAYLGHRPSSGETRSPMPRAGNCCWPRRATGRS